MATKKQRREAALAKREAFMEEQRISGLRAQNKDRQRRKLIAEKIKREADAENKRHQSILAASRIHKENI